MGIQIFNIVYLIVLEYSPFTGKSRAALVGELERLWYARFKRIHTVLWKALSSQSLSVRQIFDQRANQTHQKPKLISV